MPSFPTYRGELPKYLHPLNPRHYLLLGYWVFFRPSGFNSYLYQASPEIYQQEGWRKIRSSWRDRAYRNLYLMLPGAIALFLLLSGLILLIFNLGTSQGHMASINVVSAPTNQIAISGEGMGLLHGSSLKVWDLQSGAVLHDLTGHKNGINAIAVTPDGKTAVSASGDRTLNVWDLERGKLRHSLKGHGRWVTDVAITADGLRAVSASGDRNVKIWDLQRGGKSLHTLKGHEDGVNSVAIIGGDRAISASADGTLKVWNLDNGSLLETLSGHTASVNVVQVLPDNRRAISASADNTLKVWDLQQGEALQTLTGHNQAVRQVVLIPNSDRAISGSADSTLKIWDLQQGRLLQTLTGHDGWVNAIAVTPDGRLAVSGASDGILKIWDLQQGTLLHSMKAHRNWVRAIAVTPDGQRAISVSSDRQPKLWDLQSGREVALGQAGSTLFLASVAFNVVGVLLVASTIFAIAVVLAIGVMLFGVAGSILSAIFIGLIASFALTLLVVWADQSTLNPLFQQAFGAIEVNVQTVAIAFGITMGLVVGLAFGMTSRRALGILVSVAFIFILGVGLGVVNATILKNAEISAEARIIDGIRIGRKVAWGFNGAVLIGALRAILYPLDLGLSIPSLFRRTKVHPVEWDELLVFPVLGSQKSLVNLLQRDEKQGVRALMQVIRNPFQRWVAQRALKSYLLSSSHPLQTFYGLINSPDLNSYVLPPVSRSDWQVLPTYQQVFLGELSGTWLNFGTDWAERSAQQLVYGLTWILRDRRKTPLTQFAGLLYQLTVLETHNNFDGIDDLNLYSKLSDYPGGGEISRSYGAFSRFLNYQQIADLPQAVEVISGLTADENSLRPGVLTVLGEFAEIGVEVGKAQSATTLVDQLAGLARAIAHLESLNGFISLKVAQPEQKILQKIIQHWQRLICQKISEISPTNLSFNY